MQPEYKLSETVNSVREFAFQVLDKNSDVNLYTNISLLYRIEKNIKKILATENIDQIDLDALFLANYIYSIGQSEFKFKGLEFDHAIQHLDAVVDQINERFSLEDSLLEKAKSIASQIIPFVSTELDEAKVLSDATVMDFACDQGRDRLKLMYEQMILRDFDLTKSNWYDTLIPILQNYETYTNYGQTEVQPLIDKLSKNLKKERKEIENRNDLLVQKELNISDEEIKKLKNGLKKINNRDDRGIQTLFRNTSKNHYKINQMVDGKARIMITVVSILLSLVAGGVIGRLDEGFPNSIPAYIFIISNLLSIGFAIIAITPNRTQGNFTEEEVRSKKGNLLYFGNFHNMHYRDFEWAFLQMLQDKDYLYSSMIRDIYYQGQVLHRKSSYIRVSLFSFLAGLVLSLLLAFFLHLV